MKGETARLKIRRYLDQMGDESKILEYCRNYENREGSDLLYYLALQNLDRPEKELNVELVISVLKMFLYEWNFNFYRVKDRRDNLEHDLGDLWNRGGDRILRMRKMDIRKDSPGPHKKDIISLFKLASEFKSIGSIGGAKALHMLCPSYLTPFDNQIWTAYHRDHEGYHTPQTCKNDEACYYNFIKQCHNTILKLPYQKVVNRHPNRKVAAKFRVDIPPTKILDECNWIRWNPKKSK
ncbi:MAG: hypothetical protein KAR39_02860 [Thermoplasmata archaeon]|nr:hypothetical protein [Thermoplasmata archaeon]